MGQKTRHEPGHAVLRRFLADHELTLEAAAKALGTTKSSISLWATRQIQPRAEWRAAIEKWTSGAVPAQAWMTATDRAIVAKVVPHSEQATAAPRKGSK